MIDIIAKSNTEDIEFQIIFSLALGLLLGQFSWGLFYTFLFIVFYEIYVITITSLYPPSCKILDRLNINLFFIFGFIISRICFKNETGFEEIRDTWNRDLC